MNEEKRISVVINTRNAAQYLQEVIDAVQGFDEVLICDMESEDETLDIARRNGCSEVYLNVYYHNQRAFKAYVRAGMTDYYRCLQMIGDGVIRNDYVMRMAL